MRLRLNLFDVDVQLKINNWRRSAENEDWYDEWCNVELNFKSKYLNYSPSGELLMCGEVLELCDYLKELLSGELKEETHISFVEPDLEFNLRPTRRIIYGNDYRDFDVYGDWIIHFWCSGGLGGNSFTMLLSRAKLEAIYNYLKYVVGECSCDDPSILAMLKDGTMLPD